MCFPLSVLLLKLFPLWEMTFLPSKSPVSELFYSRCTSNSTHSRNLLNLSPPCFPWYFYFYWRLHPRLPCVRAINVCIPLLQKWTISSFLSSSNGDWKSFIHGRYQLNWFSGDYCKFIVNLIFTYIVYICISFYFIYTFLHIQGSHLSLNWFQNLFLQNIVFKNHVLI